MKSIGCRNRFKHLFTVVALVVLHFSPIYLLEGFAQVQSKSEGNRITLADPTIFFHEGVYYLYGTVEGNVNEGFEVYSSKDLKEWEGPLGVKDGFALVKEDVFGDKGFWAPQVFFYNNRFYMSYTANEQIALAESESPLGPFVQGVKKPLEAPVRQIDSHVFIDENGKKYLYHVRLDKGNRIFVAELNDDFSGIKDETLQECIVANEQWENTANANWPVAEGPTVLKHKNFYYLTYSANDFRNPDYAVGYAVSKSPLGPWVKVKENPILSKNNLGPNGTGHGDLFKGKNSQLFYVFHTHQSTTAVGPRMTAIVKASFAKPESEKKSTKLKLDLKSFYYLKKK
ncbi:glycoside hydrolase family 43 protein [Rufibacter roseus]|uniref:Glycoside hydrolase family 43 protein n=1 Tax=Rufibacter roseus TaxID=1567108 RepID=A0ABW2DKK5_9BACT|nr:glycoside hydrolase family 43 protein [Rufibacter roseus]